MFDYRLMNGTPGKSAFWQMLQHVVNHGSYHRGQVTTMLRQLGAAPAEEHGSDHVLPGARELGQRDTLTE